MTTQGANKTIVLTILLALGLCAVKAQALPAFARRYHTTCTMCHTNGSAPHLTEFGYLFRRMAFHFPGELGNADNDVIGMKMTNHTAIGVNVSYEFLDNHPSNGSTALHANGIEVPEVEFWPLEGGFFGNFGVWSEIDSAPATSTNSGGVDLAMADLRYAYGTMNHFYNFRAGLMAPEGYGASDQWLDDGNIPYIDQFTPEKNQDTLAVPFGAMEQPMLGFEAGYNYYQSHLTLGYYDGFDGSTGAVLPATLKTQAAGSRDVKLQLDQFLGNYGEFTVAGYDGSIPLQYNGSTTNTWVDNYNQARFYGTWFAIPDTLDVVGGAAWAQNHYVTNSTTPVGTFDSKGAFLGAFFYASAHWVLAARDEKYYFNPDQSASAYSLQMSFPYPNRILIFHYNSTVSALKNGPESVGEGRTNDVGLTLRFLM